MLPSSLRRRSLLALIGIVLIVVGAARAQVTAYHDVSSATHQSQFTTLSGQGWRPTSLCVSGGLSAPRYSAVWEQVSGPAWVASHDMTLQQYLIQRITWDNQGYRAKLVSAAGSGSNTVWAALWVNDGLTNHEHRDLSQFGLSSQMSTHRAAGRYPVSVDVYGTSLSPLYVAVFEPNTTDKVWGHDFDANAADFTDTRNAHDEGGERLGCLGMSESQHYISVWYDERVGNEIVRNDNTSSGWQTTFTSWTGNGYYPRVIAAGGTGSATRFSGSFAQQRFPQPRTLTITGTYRSQFAALDTYMSGLLQSQAARAGGLAVARDGKLVYARGFTLAEAGYPITQPTDAFRIASCTKPMNAIATHQLDELGLVTMATRPQTVLGLTYSDSRFDNIELRHILEYTSGVTRNYDPWTIANWASASPVLPVGLTLGSQWLADQTMLFTPATYYKYSNAAWMLSAEVIRVRSGQSFMSFLQSEVFGPLGITRIRVAPSEYSQLTPTDVLHHLNVLSLDPSELHTDRRRKSAQYAQDLNFKRTSGGLASSPVDYVRFLSGVFDLRNGDAIVLNTATVDDALERHTYTDFDDQTLTKNVCLAGMSWTTRPGGVFAYGKGGSLENASTSVSWRTDGISWAMFIDKGDSGGSSTSMHNMLEAVTSWPNVDEFPSYGLPAFPQRPEITSVAPSSLPNLTTSAFVVTGKRLDTVTQVQWQLSTITSQSPTNWQNGYFVKVSPTRLDIHPPQGQSPNGAYINVVNAVGAAAAEPVSLTLAPTFRIGAPSVVNAGQAWNAYVSRGASLSTLSPSSFTILCLSFSNQPSVAPGVVTLSLGNSFSDLLTTGAVPFNTNTNLATFALPPLPSGSIFLEAVGLDFADPSLFPLPTTNMIQVTRQ
jgi:CubicO group peptidase (beta-lactamase class C family)